MFVIKLLSVDAILFCVNINVFVFSCFCVLEFLRDRALYKKPSLLLLVILGRSLSSFCVWLISVFFDYHLSWCYFFPLNPFFPKGGLFCVALVCLFLSG